MLPSVPRQKLVEKTTPTITLPEGKGDKYRIRVISAGEGASAIYPADVLERDVAAAFPAGTRMRANHDGWFDFGGDVQRLMAKTTSAAEWDKAEQGAFADIQVSEQWSGWMAEFADVIGVSISAMGEMEDPPEDPETGEIQYAAKPTVKRLLPATESPYNSIDFVEAPGANGRIVQALEAAKATAESLNIKDISKLEAELIEARGQSEPPTPSEEDIEVDKKELEEMLAARDTALVESIKSALKPAEQPAEKPTVKQTTEAVVAAGLTEAGRDAVYEAIERGEKVDEAIAREKAREDKMREALRAELDADVQTGYVSEAGAGRTDLDSEFDDVFGALEEHAGRAR